MFTAISNFSGTGEMSNSTSTHESGPSIVYEMTTAYAIIFVIGFFGNVLIIHIVASRNYMKTTFNFLIVNMAIADMLVTLFIMPFAIKFLYYGQEWLSGGLGSVTCKVVNFSGHISIASAIIALVAISLDRYFAILHPFKHLPVIRNTKVVTTVIWVMSSIFMAPYLVLYDSTLWDNGKWICHLAWYNVSQHVEIQILFSKAYFLVTIFCLFIIPLCIIATLYSIIGRHLWFRQIPGQTNDATRRKAGTSKKKVLRMLIIVVSVFTLCWLPVHVMHFLTYFYVQTYLDIVKNYPLLEPSMYFLGHANSAINPCLYVMLNERFQREFLNIVNFGLGRTKHIRNETHSSLENTLKENSKVRR